MKIFETCGDWDEIDKKIFEWPNILSISLDYCDIGEDETYGQILYGVTLYKLSEEYKQARNKAIQELKASEEAKNPKKIHEVTNQKTELVLETNQKSATR
jgi:formiminotetrahydrofolate cyclodeaminase